MRFPTRKQRSGYRLGELLLEAGIISPDVLSHGLLIAKRTSMPLGRVLVMSGHVSELDVDSAVETQTSIRTGSIEVRIARELLRFAHVHQVSIDEAYRLNGISRGLGPLSRLGKLLMAAGLVDEPGLKCALRHSESTGNPLGKALLSLELVDQSTLIDCMNLQILIRDRRLKFLEAVKALQLIESERLTVETALRRLGLRFDAGHERPRIAELLVDAGLLSEDDHLLIIELSAETDRATGALLRERGLVPSAVIEAAAQMQFMFEGPSFTRARASRLLRLVHTLRAPLEKVLHELDVLDQAVTLLRASGLISEKVMRDTASSIVDFEQSVGEVLIARGVITPAQTRAAFDTLNRIQSGKVSYERGLEYLRRLDQHSSASAQAASVEVFGSGVGAGVA